MSEQSEAYRRLATAFSCVYKFAEGESLNDAVEKVLKKHENDSDEIESPKQISGVSIP